MWFSWTKTRLQVLFTASSPCPQVQDSRKQWQTNPWKQDHPSHCTTVSFLVASWTSDTTFDVSVQLLWTLLCLAPRATVSWGNVLVICFQSCLLQLSVESAVVIPLSPQKYRWILPLRTLAGDMVCWCQVRPSYGSNVPGYQIHISVDLIIPFPLLFEGFRGRASLVLVMVLVTSCKYDLQGDQK